jgi:sterol desaturase/sphingolipid hydroxylase (fatty acid hydroxylase superfamily)
MGSHILTTWTWFILALFTTLNAHCGYHIPLFPSPEAHDYHHLKFNNCFGVIGVLDRLHKTDANFRASHVYKRHVMLNFDLLNDQINLKS